MSKKIKKRANQKFKKHKSDSDNKDHSKVKYHLDDKGRRVFELDQIKIEKKEQEEKRKENLKKNQINSTFICKECGLTFTDNISLQEHFNSKQHNKTVGNTMNIKEVGINTIKEKMLKIKLEREKQKEKERNERLLNKNLNINL